ncbi:MAG: ROK family protein [Bacteroidales bacterium]|nr:ROK family protein [Bacteroidales bacterium]
MRSNTRIILLDVGGTFVKASLGIPGTGAVEGTFTHTPISSDGTAEEIENAFRVSVGGRMKAAADEGYEVSAVCVAIPGPFNYSEGIFLMKHKFMSVYGKSFREILGDIIAPQVRLAFVHDVNGVLLGAMAADSSLRNGNVAVSTFGTGLGFAYAVDGQVQESETGSPAKGLWNVPYMDGILEDYVSRRAILRFYAELGGCLAEGEDVKEISIRARRGESDALEAFRLAGRHYAAGAKELIGTLGIRHLMFAGQIAKSFDLMEKEIRDGLGEAVSISVLDDIQGTVLIGAASL